MTITTLEGVEFAKKQTARFGSFGVASNKVRNIWYSVYMEEGADVANTTTGVVPVAGDSIFPSLVDDTSVAWYLSRVRTRAAFGNGGSVDGLRVHLHDVLWRAGHVSLSAAATTSFSSQPSFASRLPSGTYDGLMLVVEPAGSGFNTTITVSYTNQSGVSGRTWTGTFGTNSFRAIIVPLQAGDTGVQKCDSVQVTGTVGGAILDVSIVRPLAMFRSEQGAGMPTQTLSLDVLGMPRVYGSSAFSAWWAIDNNGFDWWPSLEVDIDLVGA